MKFDKIVLIKTGKNSGTPLLIKDTRYLIYFILSNIMLFVLMLLLIR